MRYLKDFINVISMVVMAKMAKVRLEIKSVET
jgi:hypothetical protein